MRDERRKAIEAESELKEQSVMQRLKYSEAMQHIADLKQAIAHLELKVQVQVQFIHFCISHIEILLRYYSIALRYASCLHASKNI